MNIGGQRQPKQQKGKEKLRQLETELANTQVGVRFTQAMVKNLLEQFQGLRRDLDNSMGILNDFQYRTQAIMELTGLDVEKLDELADGYKLKDYMTASDKEDEVKGFELDNEGEINEDSVVIITSSTDGDEDRGIFRSKFSMSECQTETLREKLLGKRVGDTVEEDINGQLHSITIVGLRKQTQQEDKGEQQSEENESN